MHQFFQNQLEDMLKRVFIDFGTIRQGSEHGKHSMSNQYNNNSDFLKKKKHIIPCKSNNVLTKGIWIPLYLYGRNAE